MSRVTHRTNTPQPFTLKKFLWRWHRRIGLVAALFVLLLAVTGIFINHANSLNLHSAPLPASLRALFYSVDSPAISSVQVNERWISQVNKTELYLDGQLLGACEGGLVGGLSQLSFNLLACEGELQLYSADWELIESVGEFQQLPTPIQHLGGCNSPCFQVVSGSNAGLYLLDMEQLTWGLAEQAAPFGWVQFTEAPAEVHRSIDALHFGNSISWERWILDLHSGRFLGSWGVWLMDLMALLFIFSAITGVSAWWLARSRRS